MLKEVSYKDLKFNPFRLIGDEWMLVTAGNEKDGCNTMTASWGGIGCLWGHNDPVATIYLRPSRYTKEFVDKEDHFTLCVMDKSFKKQMAYIGSVSGRDEDKIAKTGLTPVYADGRLYFHSALSGHKVDAIRKCDKASFCVIEQDEVHPEKYTTFFRSFIAFGRIHIIEDETEKLETARMLVNRYSPNQEEALQKELENGLSRMLMIRFDIEHLTGKEAIELVRRHQK